ncbi:MAG: hypothetical protein JO352_09145 [Chloroflexi bacterium]|nr:hypothetical protein [Chloroflexota bacterium]
MGTLVLLLSVAPPTLAAPRQGHQGLQGGWAVDDGGHLNFPHSLRSELPFIQQGGAGVLRLNFRLGACFADWTSAGCAGADGANALAVYDSLVNEAINTYHLKVIGLISNEAWQGDQTQWTANNAELNVSGTGDNAYIQNFGTNAAGVLASHFAGRIATWEVWNEPNAYTATGPVAGEFSGGSFIYPSNFAWLLKRSYAAIKAAEPGTSSTVISGGLLGTDVGGATVTLVQPNGARQTVTKKSGSGIPTANAGTTCASSVPSGGDYLCNTYRMGQQEAGWSAGAYPLDSVGQHLYIDQGGVTSSSKIASYLQDLRGAYLAFEGNRTAKKTEITEFGWVANPGDTGYQTEASNQASNVQIAYSTFRGTSYVLRADYFVAQDVPEGNVFYGLVQGDGVTYKPAFGAYQRYASY